MAQVERQKLISKGLIMKGCHVTVLNRYGIHNREKSAGVLWQGNFEGIDFMYASGHPYRESAFLRRNLLKVKGFVNEIRFIIGKSRKQELDAVLISTNEFYNVLVYSIIAAVCGVTSVLDNVEFWTAHRKKKSLLKRIDNYLYDYFAFRCVDRVLCISNFLMDLVKSKAASKPVLKVPAIVDFTKFAYQAEKEAYFLFCGSAAYTETIHFVINAYTLLRQTRFKLYLVTSGSDTEEASVRDAINNNQYKDSIHFFSRLPYQRLIQLYTSSSALLIPLRNNGQDKARFPHKIGEYCAAKGAIISTKYGEINYYFSDQVNALLSDAFDEKQFSDKMRIVVENPKLAQMLGLKSYKTGQMYFDHEVLGEKIFNFIKAHDSAMEFRSFEDSNVLSKQ
ncbi:glycosyltransferase [Pontibacter sp. H249]|uniref:glycosyltransferase n=1 Tax=Pontibacter sp. H249 TaxID=3133420 RepID=UPI0030BDBFB9